jgi:hypothetical protein
MAFPAACRAATLAVAALLVAACATAPERPQASGVPALPAAVPERFDEMIVPDFAETAAVADLNLGQRIADYFAGELRGTFKGKTTRLAIPAVTAAAAEGRDVWRSAGAGTPSAVFLFGVAGLNEQAQKALNEGDMPKDGPFRLEGRGLVERKRFILTIDVFLIEAATGEVIWKHELRETKFYDGLSTVPEYALTDLLPAVRARLFPLLFGSPSAAR